MKTKRSFLLPSKFVCMEEGTFQLCFHHKCPWPCMLVGAQTSHLISISYDDYLKTHFLVWVTRPLCYFVPISYNIFHLDMPESTGKGKKDWQISTMKCSRIWLGTIFFGHLSDNRRFCLKCAPITKSQTCII